MKIFISFDERYDQDLYESLVQQSFRPGSSFEVVRSQASRSRTRGGSKNPRASIRSAEEVVFLCGEHTNESLRMSIELGIAREEKKPYLLVWGRRDRMCKKPEGSLPRDGMYSWTLEILESQMETTLRAAEPRVIPDSWKRATQRDRSAPSRPVVATDAASVESSHDREPKEPEQSR